MTSPPLPLLLSALLTTQQTLLPVTSPRSPVTSNPYTYTAREYDSETGLLYYRARTLDPRLGRFLQEDPQSYTEEILANTEGAMLAQPAQGNAYPYALDNPVNLTDPDGRQATNWGNWGAWIQTLGKISMQTGQDIRGGYLGPSTQGAGFGYGVAAPIQPPPPGIDMARGGRKPGKTPGGGKQKPGRWHPGPRGPKWPQPKPPPRPQPKPGGGDDDRGRPWPWWGK